MHTSELPVRPQRPALEQPASGEWPQLAAQRFGRRDDQVAQLAETCPASIDGALARSHQRPQRFASPAGTRLRRPLLREHNPGSADRVERVGLAARPTFPTAAVRLRTLSRLGH